MTDDRGRTKHVRVLVMNCTHDRNGQSFLTSILSKAKAMLLQAGETDITAENFFDHVFFTTNVTYADGGFKGGKSHASLTTFAALKGHRYRFQG